MCSSKGPAPFRKGGVSCGQGEAQTAINCDDGTQKHCLCPVSLPRTVYVAHSAATWLRDRSCMHPQTRPWQLVLQPPRTPPQRLVCGSQAAPRCCHDHCIMPPPPRVVVGHVHALRVAGPLPALAPAQPPLAQPRAQPQRFPRVLWPLAQHRRAQGWPPRSRQALRGLSGRRSRVDGGGRCTGQTNV